MICIPLTRLFLSSHAILPFLKLLLNFQFFSSRPKMLWITDKFTIFRYKSFLCLCMSIYDVDSIGVSRQSYGQ